MNEKYNEHVNVSVILPAYNEAETLHTAVERVLDFLSEIVDSYEVMIAEDGSTDGTDRIASRLSEKHSRVEHIHSDIRLGKGQALRNALKKSKGEILVYMDVDLATDIKDAKALVDSIRGGYDFVIGSRRLQESREERKIMRKIASRAYNLLAKKFLNSEICDHQCGFKAFHRKPLLRILDDVDAVHWFWDTELLVRASQRGFRIKEIPVTWKGLGKTKVNLFTDALSMGFQIFKLWWKLRNQVFTEENP